MNSLNRRQRLLLFAIIVLFAILVVLLVLTIPSLLPEREEKGPAVRVEIPEAEDQGDPGTKTEQYRRGGIGDYWDHLAEEEQPAGPPAYPDQAFPSSGGSPGRRPPKVEVEDIFGDLSEESAPSPSNKPAPIRRGGGKTVSERVPEKTPVGASAEEPTSQDAETPPARSPVRPAVKRSGAVSNLDTDLADELGSGFSTLGAGDEWLRGDPGKPYRCMFTRSEKIRSGQRVTLRLLEDLIIGGVHIPRNTHLQGVASVSDRLEIAVTSLDMGGRILSFHFDAYDTDGGRGIYCSDLSESRREATERGISGVSSTLGPRLGKVAREATSLGVSIVRTKSGEATVSVPSGYTFYLVEQQNP